MGRVRYIKNEPQSVEYYGKQSFPELLTRASRTLSQISSRIFTVQQSVLSYSILLSWSNLDLGDDDHLQLLYDCRGVVEMCLSVAAGNLRITENAK